MNRKGFTLLEMLVVIGIIAVLMGALFMMFSPATDTARKSKITHAVQEVASAFEKVLLDKGRWPTDLGGALVKYGGKDGQGMGCVEDVTRVLAKYNAYNVSYKGSRDTAAGIQLIGVDRCGIVDPLAAEVLKRHSGEQGAGKDLKVPSGGTVQDHIIYYAIDDDHDGIVVANVCGETVRVRAKAIAWSAGADGKLGSCYRKREKQNADNVYSWTRAQEERK